MHNIVTQRKSLHPFAGVVLAIAAIAFGVYSFVPESGRILWLTVPDWFWMAILTLPISILSLLKQRRVLFTCSICWLSLSLSIYLFGAARAASERIRFEQYVGLTKPHELPDTAIGSRAPEIEATDLLAERMKLSQFRGKVVLLVFWASWCGPCMRDVEHEKELQEKFKGRPFEIIGVNCDFERAQGQHAAETHTIPWRSFWDGGDDGPIAKQWGIQAWPSIFVIDDQGIIRFNYLRGDSLDVPLEILVKSAEAKQLSAK